MTELRHSIYDLYDYLQFDKSIQNSWKTKLKERDVWINFNNNDNGMNRILAIDSSSSLLLYRKGNHHAFSTLFDRYYSEHSTRAFQPEGNLNWYIPYKDPVDKLLGGYLSSHNFTEFSHLFKAKGSEKPNVYKDLEPYLIKFVDKVLEGNVVKSSMYDMHMTPLSITLENALLERPAFLLSRLIGLNLDTRSNIWPCIYRPIVQHQDNITQDLIKTFVNRRSPYSEQKKYYLLKFKYDHAHKIRELVHGVLYNEYKLLDFFEHHMYIKDKFYNG